MIRPVCWFVGYVRCYFWTSRSPISLFIKFGTDVQHIGVTNINLRIKLLTFFNFIKETF